MNAFDSRTVSFLLANGYKLVMNKSNRHLFNLIYYLKIYKLHIKLIKIIKMQLFSQEVQKHRCYIDKHR